MVTNVLALVVVIHFAVEPTIKVVAAAVEARETVEESVLPVGERVILWARQRGGRDA